MGVRTVVDLIEEWQTGAFLLGVSVIGGFLAAFVLGSLRPDFGGLYGLTWVVVVSLLSFLVLSVLFGR